MTVGQKLIEAGYEVRIFGKIEKGLNVISPHKVIIGLNKEIRIFKTTANLKELSFTAELSLPEIMKILKDKMDGQPLMLMVDGEYLADDLLVKAENGIGFLYTVEKKDRA